MKLYKLKNIILTPIPIGRLDIDFNLEVQSIYPENNKVYKWEITKNLYGKGVVPNAFNSTLSLNPNDFDYSFSEKRYKPKPGGNYYMINNGNVFLCHSPLFNLVAIIQAVDNCELRYSNNLTRKIEEGIYYAFLPNRYLPVKYPNPF